MIHNHLSTTITLQFCVRWTRSIEFKLNRMNCVTETNVCRFNRQIKRERVCVCVCVCVCKYKRRLSILCVCKLKIDMKTSDAKCRQQGKIKVRGSSSKPNQQQLLLSQLSNKKNVNSTMRYLLETQKQNKAPNQRIGEPSCATNPLKVQVN